MSTPQPSSKDIRQPSPGPGRPKDLAKRAAILEAAERMFLRHGYEGVSMDQIAAAAGVSKLTVYSHFGDKGALFTEAARSWCEQQMPVSLFERAPHLPVRERLMDIAHSYFTMVCSPEAVAGHRLLCSPQMVEKQLARLFWEAGPERVQAEFARFLERRIAVGDLVINDVQHAAGQFFALVRGDLHSRLVFDCDDGEPGHARQQAHLEAAVDMFLRAYGARDPAQ
ncbi:MAG: TetR/AcrR family transcriptional regulator [Gammaproteobacteria bacterium]|nr:TetR/AcrR family transcriptional regulator [Gammaproteobacteria bacterium]